MKIQVRVQNVFGSQVIYPVCEQAWGFCRLLGQKTLTLRNISDIRKIGFQIEVSQPEVVLG